MEAKNQAMAYNEKMEAPYLKKAKKLNYYYLGVKEGYLVSCCCLDSFGLHCKQSQGFVNQDDDDDDDESSFCIFCKIKAKQIIYLLLKVKKQNPNGGFRRCSYTANESREWKVNLRGEIL